MILLIIYSPNELTGSRGGRVTTFAFIKIGRSVLLAGRLTLHVSYGDTAMDLRTHTDKNHNFLEEWRVFQQEKKNDG